MALSTSEKIRRALRKNPEANNSELAERFGCSPSLVGQIKKGELTSPTSNAGAKKPKVKKLAKPTALNIMIDGVSFNMQQLQVILSRFGSLV